MRRLAAVVAAAALVPAGTALAEHPSTHGHPHSHSGHGATGHGTTHANAALTCRAERAMDPAAFADKYGTGPRNRNAFGRCVSQNVRQGLSAHDKTVLNAARACRSERADDAEAFRSKYGTGHNGRNAFGKCVSQHTRGHTS